MNRGDIPFLGIMPDTGCAQESTGGLIHYHAYCRHVGSEPRIDTSRRVLCVFGKGSAWSIGTAKIQFPFRDRYLSFNMHIVLTQCPILLSHGDMNRLRVTYDNLEGVLKHPDSGVSVPVTVEEDSPYIRWDPVRDNPLAVTEPRLHRRQLMKQAKKRKDAAASSNASSSVNFPNRAESIKINRNKRPLPDRRPCTQPPPKPYMPIPLNLVSLSVRSERNTRHSAEPRDEHWM